MIGDRLWLSATEAAGVLGVNRATLYAYVSRGYVRSQTTAGASRARGYSRDDVERLRRRTEARRRPDQAAAGALQWGMPVLESAITLIDGQRLYYRGHDAVVLSRVRSVKEVAALIWTGRFEAAFPTARREKDGNGSSRTAGMPFVTRAHVALAQAAARDPSGFDVRPEPAALCGWRVLHLLAASAGAYGIDPTIDQALGRRWRVGAGGIDVIRGALILCADHELNVSAFTARCVASAGSSPYAVVMAGLAALEGPKHGGAGARVEAALASMRRERHLRRAIGARLRRGEPIDGFGHRLYPNGDPRARALLQLLRDRYEKSAELAFVLEFATAATAAAGEPPNLDFALAAVTRVLRLPSGSPLALFAIGRAIGWVGHAIEQYAADQLIRPRAKYVGVAPAAVES